MDKTPKNTNYHSGFLSGMEIILWPYGDQVGIELEKWISTQGMRIEALILQK